MLILAGRQYHQQDGVRLCDRVLIKLLEGSALRAKECGQISYLLQALIASGTRETGLVNDLWIDCMKVSKKIHSNSVFTEIMSFKEKIKRITVLFVC